MDSRGVTNASPGFEDAGKRWGFKKGSEEEVPLKVGKREELLGGRHREPKMGSDPSFYIVSYKILLLPSGGRRDN